MTRPATKPAMTPLILLGIMTVLTFGGPFGLLWILNGGAHGGWPPDRPVEWVVFTSLCVAVAVLMLVLLVRGIASSKELRAAREKAARPAP